MNGPDETRLLLAFAPLHKAAFGAAIGTAAAFLMFLATAGVLVTGQADPVPLIGAFRAFFRGYTISWTGALVGALWAGGVGFVFGWFIAFCRNFVIAVSIFLIRTRAERAQVRDFLDHV